METLTSSTGTNSDSPSQTSRTMPPGKSTTAPMTNGTIPPRPQIKLKFNPPAKLTVTQENQDPIATPVPSEPVQAPMTGPSNNQHPIPTHPQQTHPFPISTSNELWPTQRKSGRLRARLWPSH